MTAPDIVCDLCGLIDGFGAPESCPRINHPDCLRRVDDTPIEITVEGQVQWDYALTALKGGQAR